MYHIKELVLGWVLWPPSGVSGGSLCLRNLKSEMEYMDTEAFCPFLLTISVCVLVDSFKWLFPWAAGPLALPAICLGTSIILPSVLTLNDYKKSRNFSFLCMAAGQGQFSGRFLEKVIHTLLLTLLQMLGWGREKTKLFIYFRISFSRSDIPQWQDRNDNAPQLVLSSCHSSEAWPLLLSCSIVRNSVPQLQRDSSLSLAIYFTCAFINSHNSSSLRKNCSLKFSFLFIS